MACFCFRGFSPDGIFDMVLNTSSLLVIRRIIYPKPCLPTSRDQTRNQTISSTRSNPAHYSSAPFSDSSKITVDTIHNLHQKPKLMSILHCEYVSPCSPVVLTRWGHDVQQDPEGECERVFLKRVKLDEETRWISALSGNDKKGDEKGGDVSSQALLTHSASTRSPFPAPSHSFPSLFSSFPRTFISIGTAERLTRECASLVRAMEKDGVEVRCEWVEDACHDVLIVPEWWWNKPVGVLEGVWRAVEQWVEGV